MRNFLPTWRLRPLHSDEAGQGKSELFVIIVRIDETSILRDIPGPPKQIQVVTILAEVRRSGGGQGSGHGSFGLRWVRRGACADRVWLSCPRFVAENQQAGQSRGPRCRDC